MSALDDRAPASANVAVIGEALVDIVDGTAHPGGSPMNVAVGLARLGSSVVLHTRIGADAHGDLIRAHLGAAGVEPGPVSLVDGPSWTAEAELDATGSAHYAFALDGAIAVPPLAGERLLHAGSFGAVRAEEATAVLAAFAAADRRALRSFDPNIRADVLGEGARERVLALAARSDVLKLSDEDADWLFPGRTAAQVLEELAAHGARVCVMTRGAEGSIALVDGRWIEHAARRVAVVDTIGAGDAFMSGLLHALLADGTDRVLAAGAAVSQEAIVRALEVAGASAAITVSRAGANPPYPDELDRMFRASSR